MARDSFLLRTDPLILDALRRWAEDEFRSVNGQIEFLLRQALRDSGRLATRTARDAEAGRETPVARDEEPGSAN